MSHLIVNYSMEYWGDGGVWSVGVMGSMECWGDGGVWSIGVMGEHGVLG